jgi:hypothetical protein
MTTLHKAPNPSLKNRPLAKLLKGCTFSGQLLADNQLLPDWLALSEIAELFDPDDLETLIGSCLDKELAYEGKLYGLSFTDETLKGVITYQLPEGQYSRRADYRAIHKDKFKRFLLSQGQWPVIGLLANWWPDNGQKAIKRDEPKIKPRNKQRDNAVLDLLHAALNEMEAEHGNTPSHTELAAFVLSGDFKHSNIQERHNAEEGSLINNRVLILTDGTKLDRAVIKSRYQRTIYSKSNIK